jgi:DNA-binding transcriptional LysR family regulator
LGTATKRISRTTSRPLSVSHRWQHGTNAIDYVDIALAQLGQHRSVALSVPQFATAAMCLDGTPHIAMLPKSMARRLVRPLPLRLCEPPLPLPAVTIMQVWHTRTDADPGTVLLRSVIREAGSQKR